MKLLEETTPETAGRPRWGRRLVLVALVLLAASTPAFADNIDAKKHRVDSKAVGLQTRIGAARLRESVLRQQIAGVSTQISALEGRVLDVSTRLDTLQRDLALRQARLDDLAALYALETRRYQFERQQYLAAVERLNARLVQIYESNDPTVLEVVLASKTVSEAVDRINYLSAISGQDRLIAQAVGTAKVNARRQQLKTGALKDRVRNEVQAVAVRTYQQGAVKARLLGVRGDLTQARDQQNRQLVSVQANERDWVKEADALQATSQSLAAQIQAAQAAASARAEAARIAAAVQTTAPTETPTAPTDTATPPASTGATPAAPPAAGPSSSGLIWPLQGTVTSPFGMRWGKLHPGLDISDPTGTPIHAAGAGTVIVAAYDGGYGNLVVIDHGNGIATAYAHQDRIAVSVGQTVGQGDVIGYVGSTGFSTGPHLHFEVRVNGQPVDPLSRL